MIAPIVRQANDVFERVRVALDWWMTCDATSPTSSLTGGGAIAELESLLSERFAGHCLALPSGSSAIRTGLLVLGAGPGSAITLVGSGWFGSAGLVRAVGGRVGACPEVADFMIVDAPYVTRHQSAQPTLVDAANLAPEHYDDIALRDWSALALSFGPGKPVDAGEGGALIVRSRSAWETAIRLTQHPIRQRLSGGDQVNFEGPSERIHPIAALVALHALSYAQ